MSWLRLSVETDTKHVDAVTELVEQFGASSISYAPITDEALFADPTEATVLWQQTSVSALLDSEIDLDILLACLRNKIGTKNILQHKIEALPDQEWTEAYKKGIEPMLFAERLYITPSWLPRPANDKPSIILDPGLAFGTGSHPTTSLCLKWLAQSDLDGKTIIDYGCGSGILSLAAAKLGADKVYAVDIDPQALSATESNATNNKLEKKLVISLPEDADLPEADILIANILLNPLLNFAPKFNSKVKLGGQIALSGILAGQVEECLERYSHWFNMEAPKFHEEWALIYGYR